MLWSTHWIVRDCCGRKKPPGDFFLLGSMTDFKSICTSVLQEHKYQTVLTCTQLENIYFMRGMTLFNSTVFTGYEPHVDNKLEPYTISNITLLKNLSFREGFFYCVLDFWRTQKKRKQFTSHIHIDNTYKRSGFTNNGVISIKILFIYPHRAWYNYREVRGKHSIFWAALIILTSPKESLALALSLRQQGKHFCVIQKAMTNHIVWQNGTSWRKISNLGKYSLRGGKRVKRVKRTIGTVQI